MIRTLKTRDGTFQVLDVGEGSPCMLVHGFPLDHELWIDQVEALAGRVRVIVPDLRGFGGSVVSTGTVTMDRHADDLAAILDALEVTERIVLGGLSMGGYVVFAFMNRHADRVRSLALMATRAEADTPEAAGGRLQMAEEVLKAGPAPVVDAMMPKLIGPASAKRDPALVDRVRAMLMRQSRDGIAATLRGMAIRMNAFDMLGSIKVPTWLIAGSDDVITPPAGMKAMADAIEDATYVEIKDVGHLVAMEAAGDVNDVLARIVS